MKYCAVFGLFLSAVYALPHEVLRKPTSLNIGTRIVGGEPAEELQVPSQVAVYFDRPNGTFFCGGSLISPQWIITAGSCVYGATIFTLHLGANTLVNPDDNRVTVATAESTPHPDYVPTGIDNDIGLIHVTTRIPLNEHIQPVNLARTALAAGVNVTTFGWGKLGDWDSGVSNVLNTAQLSTISNADCSDAYSDTISEKMVCTTGSKEGSYVGTCDGDFGGPLLTGTGSTAVLHGVTSFISSAGCEAGDPSGFTRILPYLDWISEETGLEF